MSHGYDKFVGIDVSKTNLDVFSAPDRSSHRFENTTDGASRLLKMLPAPGTALIVVEATGGYEREVVGVMVADGHPVAVVNPRQVRDFARALNILAKTDRIDAAVLAEFAEKVQPTPREKQGEIKGLRELVARRRQLVEHRTAEKNRIALGVTRLVRKSILGLIGAINKDIKANCCSEKGGPTQHNTQLLVLALDKALHTLFTTAALTRHCWSISYNTRAIVLRGQKRVSYSTAFTRQMRLAIYARSTSTEARSTSRINDS